MEEHFIEGCGFATGNNTKKMTLAEHLSGSDLEDAVQGPDEL